MGGLKSDDHRDFQSILTEKADLQISELFLHVIEHVVIVCNIFGAIGDQFFDARLQN